MTRYAITIQELDARKDTMYRTTVGTLHKGTVLDAVERMLDDKEAHTLGRVAKRKRTRAADGAGSFVKDGEVIPGT